MVTGEMVEELILAGADIIKVGIGPGKLENKKQQTIDFYLSVIKIGLR